MYTSYIIINTVYEVTAFLKLAMYRQGCRPSALPDFGIYEQWNMWIYSFTQNQMYLYIDALHYGALRHSQVGL